MHKGLYPGVAYHLSRVRTTTVLCNPCLAIVCRDAVRNGRRHTAADSDRSDHARGCSAASKERSGVCTDARTHHQCM